MPGLPGRVQRSRPGGTAPLERDEVDQAEHFAERLRARYALCEGQTTPQPIQAFAGIIFIALAIVGAADYAHKGASRISSSGNITIPATR
jgi:hypothetical protein